MTEIKLITAGHPAWRAVISFAEGCSWKAGPFLAEKMRQNDFLSWERVCAAFADSKAVGFCTFADKDELPDWYDFSPFIGFVFVDEMFRGMRLSQAMIEEIIPYARSLGYRMIYVMSGETGLYEKFGFRKIGDFSTIYGTLDQLFVKYI